MHPSPIRKSDGKWVRNDQENSITFKIIYLCSAQTISIRHQGREGSRIFLEAPYQMDLLGDICVPRGSVFGPILYILYIAYLPSTRWTTRAISQLDPNIAITIGSKYPSEICNAVLIIRKLFANMANDTISVQLQMTFSMRSDHFPLVQLNGQELPQADDAKYLRAFIWIVDLHGEITW